MDFFKKFPKEENVFVKKKFNYDEQPLIDSFSMDDSLIDKENSKETEFPSESQMKSISNTFMSQSIIKKSRSRSLCSTKRVSSKKPKNFKEPVVLVSSNKRQSQARSNSISTFQSQSQFVIPDSQDLTCTQFPLETQASKEISLRIKLIQDNELISLSKFGANFWENLSNGLVDLKKEFKADFDF